MSLARFFTRYRRSQRGATAVTVALFMTVMIGLCGFTIDVGHVAWVQRELQSASDAAALAGAAQINCCSTTSAASTATAYSAVAGKNNAISGVTATMVSGYPKLKCFTSTGIACTFGTGVDSANGIQVKESASVPMWFSAIFGITAIPVTSTSTASVGGYGSTSSGTLVKSLDIEVVLDTTQSMNSSDSSCGSGETRLSCAEEGVQTLLKALSYTSDQVGLMVFPGVTSSTAVKDYNCSGNSPTAQTYSSSTNYSVLGLGNTFKTSSSGQSLSTSSTVVRAIGAGKTAAGGSCPGMSAPGGEGTYYAGAVNAAQTNLANNGRSGVQKIIILLSDGDANANSGSQISSGLSNNQCTQAVTAASNATSAGTEVYTIAYGADTSTSGSCSTDHGSYSACSALKAMASSPKYFFSDTQSGSSSCTSSVTGNTSSSLSTVWQNLAAQFTPPRLVPDTTS
ncbi:MAG TPA: pilus assembly protein TadG-related protein [Caulobacteraceae bacterium]|jgi:Flp pilus assembly protein TadG